MVDTDNQYRQRGSHVPSTNPPSPTAAYSGYFAPQSVTPVSTSTIRIPGDAALARVVRPALSVLFRVAIGPAADRYVRRFMTFEHTGRTRAGWHWPALLFPAGWAFYRKMWALGVLYALLPIAGAFAFAAVEPYFERADLVWIVAALLCVWILPGIRPAILADTLLYNDCRYRVFRAEQGANGATHAVQRLARGTPDLDLGSPVLRWGRAGLHSWHRGPAAGQGLCRPRRPARRSRRSWLPCAMSRDEIEMRPGRSSRLLPRQTEHVGLRAHPGAALIDDVHVNPASGRVRVALSTAVPALAGKTLLVAPTRDAFDRWQWMCVPVDIPAALPAARMPRLAPVRPPCLNSPAGRAPCVASRSPP